MRQIQSVNLLQKQQSFFFANPSEKDYYLSPCNLLRSKIASKYSQSCF